MSEQTVRGRVELKENAWLVPPYTLRRVCPSIDPPYLYLRITERHNECDEDGDIKQEGGAAGGGGGGRGVLSGATVGGRV
jgi:hypothetical protein